MKINLWLISLVAISIISLALASAQTYNCPMGGGGFVGGMMYGSYGSGAMLISWLIGLAVLVALVLLIIWLVKKIFINSDFLDAQKSQNSKISDIRQIGKKK